MAGPSVVVRVLGDLRGLGQAMQGAGSAAQSAASKAQQGFGKMLSTLNASGTLGPFGEALAGMNEAIGSVIENGKKIGPALMGAGAAVTGVGALLSSLGSKEQASHQQLKAAIDATGHTYEEFGGQIEKTIKHQENFGHTAEQTQDAIRILTQATGSTSTALKYMDTVSDVAAAKHISLSDAATKMGKAYNGNTRILKEFGISVAKAGTAQKTVEKATKAAESADKTLAAAKQSLLNVEVQDASKKHLTATEALRLREAQNKVFIATLASQSAHGKLTAAQELARKAAQNHTNALDLLAAKTKGQASAAADTFSGKLSAMRAKLEDAVATFGQKYGPAIQVAGVAMMGLGAAVSTTQSVLGLFKTSQEAAAVATEATTAAESTEAVASWAALGPLLLIIGAIAALIAIGYVIYRNWSTIWNGIKAVIGVVWDWIRTHWPLLLAILMGPIGIATLLIINNFQRIKAAIAAVVNWIVGAWSALIGFFARVAGAIGGALAGAWSGIAGAVRSATDAAIGVWNGFIGFVAGIPRRVGGALAGLWDGIWNGFKSAVDLVIRGWDALHLSVGGWTVGAGPFHVTLPTITVGLPYIHPLQTGGTITREGLFYLHAGEAVTPASKSAGPAIHIENASFMEPVDIDVLEQRLVAAMRRAS